MLSAVASRYARALVDTVLAPSSDVAASAAIAQLQSVERLLDESVELRNAMLSPAVPTARKRAVLSRFAQTLSLSRLVRNFLFVVVDHRRMGQLSEMREAFERILDERLGAIRASVTSAQDLNEHQRSQIVRELSRLSGKEVRPDFSVDAGLLGGVMARIGSTVYDGSVRGQLESLRRRLVSAA